MTKKIAFIADIHLGEPSPKGIQVDVHSNWATILDDLATRDVDEVVFGGDIGATETLPDFFASLRNYQLSVVPGNHDSSREIARYFKQQALDSQTNELFYSRDDGDFKLLFMDSSLGSISDLQFLWFQRELPAQKPCLLFIHHPILALDVEVDRRYGLEGRRQIKEELLGLPVDVYVFCGHYHMQDHRTEGNIQQYVVPSSSYQVDKISEPEISVNSRSFGYSIIRLTEERVAVEQVVFQDHR